MNIFALLRAGCGGEFSYRRLKLTGAVNDIDWPDGGGGKGDDQPDAASQREREYNDI